MTEYKMSDQVIANIAQLLQLAMITGTDVSDHFRMIRLSPSPLDEEKLELSESFVKNQEETMQKLVTEAEELARNFQKEQNAQGPAGFVE